MKRDRNCANGAQDCAANGTRKLYRTRSRALQAALLVLLFVFVFVGTIVAATGVFEIGVDPLAHIDGVANAASSKSPTSNYSHSSLTTVSLSLSANYFGISTEGNNGVNDFKKTGRGWGWDTSNDKGKRYLWWVQINFSGTLLTAVKTGLVSFQVTAHGSSWGAFEDGDDMAIGIGFVGVNSVPSYTAMSGASFSSTASSYFMYTSNWDDGSSNNYTIGTAFSNSDYEIPSNATGLRIAVCISAGTAINAGVDKIGVGYFKSSMSGFDTKEANISKTGTNIASSLNTSSNDTTNKGKFGYSTDSGSNPKDNIKRVSDQGNGWGFQDWDCGGDKATIFWAEFPFDADLITLVQLGLISWSVSVKSNFAQTGGDADECAIAVSYIGVHGKPKASHVSTSRSGDNASWASGSSSSYAWQSSWSNGGTTHTNGTTGAFSSNVELPANVTGLRLAFAIISGHKIDGSFYGITLNLYRAWDGMGTETDQFELTSRPDFDTLSHKVNGTDGTTDCPAGAQTFSGKYFKVTKAINFTTTAFTAIGGPSGYHFDGTLDGGGYTLSNVTVTIGFKSDEKRYVGLFGRTKDATIKNLKLSSCSIAGGQTSVGGLVGVGEGNLTITDCTISGAVSGTHQVGGLVGYKNGGTLTVTNCTNSASVTASSQYTNTNYNRVSVGGIVGFPDNTAVVNINGCTNSGNITASSTTDNSGTGGIVGFALNTSSTALTVTNCTNSGTIQGRACVGGIVGYTAVNTATTANGITGCKNTGTIKGLGHFEIGTNRNSAFLGGIAGYAGYAYIAHCYNKGSVSTYVGTSQAKYDYANEIGGIAGTTSGTIHYVYNEGMVGGAEYMGGIVGRKDGDGYISYAYNNGEVKCLYANNSGNHPMGEIMGQGSNVTYSWRLPNSKITATSNNSILTHGFQLKPADGQLGYFDYNPATANTSMTSATGGTDVLTSWTDICTKNIDCVRVTNHSVGDGSFFATSWDSTSGSYCHPYKSFSFKSGNNDDYSLDVSMIYKIGSGDSTAVKVVYVEEKDIYTSYIKDGETVSAWNVDGQIYDPNANRVATADNICVKVPNSETDTTPLTSYVDQAGATDNYNLVFQYQWIRIGSLSNDYATSNSVTNAGHYKYDIIVRSGSTPVGHKSGEFTIHPRTFILDWSWDGDSERISSLTHATYTYDGAFHGVQDVHASANRVSPDDDPWLYIPSTYQIGFGNDWVTYTDPDGYQRGYDKGMIVSGSPLATYLAIAGEFKTIDARAATPYTFGTTQYNFCFTIKLNDTYSSGDNEYNYSLAYSGYDPVAKKTLLKSVSLYYNIATRTLNIEPIYTEGASWNESSQEYEYTYNAAHQGLDQFTISNLVKEKDTESYLATVFGFEHTNCGDVTYNNYSRVSTDNTTKISVGKFVKNGNIINAGSYAVKIKLIAVEGLKNYKITFNGNATTNNECVFRWTIKPKELKVTVSENKGTYPYTGGITGLESITFEGLQGADLAQNVINYTYTRDYGSVTGADVKNISTFATNDKIGTLKPNSTDFGKYTIKYRCVDPNYKLPDNVANNTDVTVEWTITRHDINTGDVEMGFGDGSDLSEYVINSPNTTFASIYYTLHSLTTAADTWPTAMPQFLALVYMGINSNGVENLYNIIDDYNLFWSGSGRASNELVFGSDFSIQTCVKDNYAASWPAAADMKTRADGDTMFDNLPADVTYAYVTISGVNNFTGKLYFAFAILKHDFGGYTSTGWGTQGSPYLIENEAHMMRLASIVNGAEPWDSIQGCLGGGNPTSSMVAAKEGDHTYADCYFQMGPNGINVSTANGFEPIGKDAEHPFSAHFDGAAIPATEANKDNTAGFVKYQLGSSTTNALKNNYIGLFGYLKDATISNLRIGLAAETYIYANGVNYVGAVAGYALNTHLEGHIYTAMTINASSCDYVGGIIGKIESNFEEDSAGKHKYSSLQILDTTKNYILSITNINLAHSYVGGVFGEAVGVLVFAGNDARNVRGGAIGSDNKVFGLTANGDWVGNIAGKWTVKDISAYTDLPTTTQYTSKLAAMGYVSVTGRMYVGGLIGELDVEHGVGLSITPSLYNTRTDTNRDNITVSGTGFVGLLYGMVKGGGYKEHSPQSFAATDTIININNNDIYGTVGRSTRGDVGDVQSVYGGLFGYIEGAGVRFNGDTERGEFVINAHVKFDASLAPTSGTTAVTRHFLGGIAGIIGAGATIESMPQEDDDGNKVGGTLATIITSSTLYGTSSSANRNTFVGTIAGYVTSTAGVYYGGESRIFGNNIALVSGESVYGGSFVGGLFGAMGNLTQGEVATLVGNNSFSFGIASSLTELTNLLTTGNLNGTAATTSMVFAPTLTDYGSTAGGNGRAINTAIVYAADYFAGGLVGYVGGGARLHLVNNTVSARPLNAQNFQDYLSIFNGYSANSTVLSNLFATKYVGGIAGYAGSSLHDISGVVNNMTVGSSTTNSYAGGLFGAINGGTISNSISSAPNQSIATGTSSTVGTNSVGGIAGRIENVTLSNCYTLAFQFSTVNESRGGLVGEAYGTAKIDGSWALYMVASPTSSTTSANGNGKFVIFDASADFAHLPTLYTLAKMAGIFGKDYQLDPNVTADTNNSISTNPNNSAEEGKLSFAASIPTTNKQIALFEGDGSGLTTKNSFDCLMDNSTTVYFKLDSAESDSMIVAIVDIVMRDMSPTTDTSKMGKNQSYSISDEEAIQSYRPPAGDLEFYTLQSNGTQYKYDSKGYVTNVKTTVGTSHGVGGWTSFAVLGKCDMTLTPGTQNSPYIISSKATWNSFASQIRDGKGNYDGQYVKLTTDLVGADSIKSNELAGNYGDSNGSVEKETVQFSGEFDGGGHTIELAVGSASSAGVTGTGGVSLFPYASGAVFRNVILTGVLNAGPNSGSWDTAAFVGKTNGKLEFYNCINEALVIGYRNVAGFVGTAASTATLTIESCVNEGEIYCGEGKTFGTDTKPTPATTTGTGGIVGNSEASLTLDSCRNAGWIRAKSNVGGIVGRINAPLTVYNCTNTGKVQGLFGDYAYGDANYDFDENDDRAYCNAATCVGGIVGTITEKGYLKAYACSNSGTIIANGSLAGGIAGTVGFWTVYAGDKKYYNNECTHGHTTTGAFTDTGNSVCQAGASTIAYCYNSGQIQVGGTKPKKAHDVTEGPDGLVGALAGKECIWGTFGGGICGVIGNGTIAYCYNTADIMAYGAIGYAAAWHSSNGGIVGEAQPEESGTKVTLDHCYNVGEVITDTQSLKEYKYGSGLYGKTDKKTPAGQVFVKNCYTIKDAVVLMKEDHTTVSSRGNTGHKDTDSTYWDNGNWTATGIIDSLDQLTAVFKDDDYKVALPIKDDENLLGKESSVATLITNYTSNTAFKNGTLSGYIYIYGCLPQLAVFALDTKEGLSMLSISYGQNEVGDFVRSQAGSKESPYIIKDGIDLQAMSTLVNATTYSTKFNFKNKYVEFADGNNNTDGDTSGTIDMSNFKYSATINASSCSKTGHSYFLYANGAKGGGKNPGSNASLESTWNGLTSYYNGTNYVKGDADNDPMSRLNYFPVGWRGASCYFEGNLSGLQANDKQTVVKNIKVNLRDGGIALGLIAKAERATIKNVTLSSPIINAYVDSGNYGSIAGGIVGWAGERTLIDGCVVNSGSIRAYSMLEKSGTSDPVVTTNTSAAAGGIVGVITTAKYSSSTSLTRSRGVQVTVQNCQVSGGTIQSCRANMGGIVGYVSDGAQYYPGQNPITVNNTYGADTTFAVIDGNKVDGVTISTLTAQNGSYAIYSANIGTNVGGILGASDSGTYITLSNNSVGEGSSATTITGKHSVGGIMGYANGHITFENDVVGAKATLGRELKGTEYNHATYSTAFGGIVGASEGATFNGVEFDGTIEIKVASQEVESVGGIVGFMGKGTSFAAGSTTTVKGSIYINVSLPISHIGGVAGATSNAVFSGTFTVRPTIQKEQGNATFTGTAVGGFIGYNDGSTYIRSNNTVINIGGSIAGASEMGGFVGQNFNGSSISIGLDTYEGVSDDGDLEITIDTDATITASANNVGGLVGSNDGGSTPSSIVLRKGKIYNYATVNGQKNVGGIIGYNGGTLTTGGSTMGGTLDIRNYGTVGSLTANENVGGIIGLLEMGEIAGYFTNFGTVSGKNFVGGSIGRVGENALLVTARDALGNEIGDTQFSNYGSVEGALIVGGSIGGMFGTIRGGVTYQVTFVNGVTPSGDHKGTLGVLSDSSASYYGGNIGMLAGIVDYGEFVNNVEMTLAAADTSWAIGGSIGIIGLPQATLSGIDSIPSSATIRVSNSQFEYTGVSYDASGNAQPNINASLKLTVTGSARGVGGVIGVIGRLADFDKTNNFFVSGDVEATGSDYVGGVIGLIRANDVHIDDMLMYHTTVSGNDYVGGVVGSVGLPTSTEAEAANVSINNAFNILGTIRSAGSSSNRGGIVGHANDTTDAQSSYWVMPALTSERIQEIVDNDTWANGAEGETYNTGSANYGWYFFFANDCALYLASGGDGVNARDGIDIYHDGGPDDLEARRKYWKRIANSYTREQLNYHETAAEGDPNDMVGVDLPSRIVGDGSTSNNGLVTSGYLYAAASAGVPGKYLAVSTSYPGKTATIGTDIVYQHHTANVDPSSPADYDGNVGAVPVGGYNYTYIKLLVNQKLAGTGDTDTNNLGNIAIYYRKIADSTSIAATTKSYTADKTTGKGVEQLPEVDANKYSEFAEHITVKMTDTSTNKDNAGKYGYLARLAGGDGVVNKFTDFVQAGLYEGYIDVYLYDGNGVPKPVGEIKFGYEITPREVKLGYAAGQNTVMPEEDYTGEGYNVAMAFRVVEGSGTDEWIYYVDAADETAKINKVAEYIESFGIYFKLKPQRGATVTGEQFMPSSKSYNSYPYSNLFKLSWRANESLWTSLIVLDDVKKQGEYYIKMDAPNTYTLKEYRDGEWQDKAGLSTYPMTADGNFYFTGTSADDSVKPVDDGFECLFFQITPNDFTPEWFSYPTYNSRYNNIYKGAEFNYVGLRLTADKSFLTQELLLSEIVNANLALQTSYNRTSTTVTNPTSTEQFDLTRAIIRVVETDKDEDKNRIVEITFTVGVDAGYYLTEFKDDNPSTENCAIRKVDDNNSIFNIYQRRVDVSYKDKSNVASKTSYEYNAEQQGVYTAQFNAASGNTGFLSADNSKSATAAGIKATLAYSYNGESNPNYYSYSQGKFTLKSTYSAETIKVGTYTVTVNLGSASNYTLDSKNTVADASSSSFSWEITAYDLTVELSGDSTVTYNGAAHTANISVKHNGSDVQRVVANTDGTYTIYPFGDSTHRNNYITITPIYTSNGEESPKGAVNRGVYDVAVDDAGISYGSEANGNYTISQSGGGSIVVEAADFTFKWNSVSVFTYNGGEQGRDIDAPTLSAGFTSITKSYVPATSNGVATITVTNAAGLQEVFTITLGGTPHAKDVNEEGYKVSFSQDGVAVSGENVAGEASKDNYTFIGMGEVKYIINKAQLTEFSVRGGSVSKEFDGTVDVVDKGAIDFEGIVGADSFTLGEDYDVTATYDSASVGNDKTITYTVTLKGNAANNYSFKDNANSSSAEIKPAAITQKELVVTIYQRGGKATKVYDGTTAFGGDGASRTSGTAANSKVYRAGNGFRVEGFAQGDTSLVTVTAQYREFTSGRRGAYDSYVNNVSDDDSTTYYKQLVFKLNSSNYKLTFEGGSLKPREESSGVYVVNDASNSSAQNDTQLSVSIEITKKSVRASYQNTLQSYATPDNKFNTDWIDVTGSISNFANGDNNYVVVKVENGWQFNADGSKREYKNYTSIRGSATSALLKVYLAAREGASGAQANAYKNYNLTNYPTLIIGYFVNSDGDVFEIGSLASLMIATYYNQISGNPDLFGGVRPNENSHIVASNDDYMSNTGVPASYDTWDDYFAHLESEGHDVVFDGTNWVYYEESEGAAKVYDKFKQISDISGKFTKTDLEILNGMFKKITYNADGSENTDNSYDWGRNSTSETDKLFLANFVKGRVGDVVTVVGSVFGDFGATYDGNGYVIDGVNIMGTGGDNAGFFATISDTAKVSNVHLRNVNVVAAGVTNVGALAGTALADVSNVSVQGSLTVSGATNVGGVFGAFGGGTGDTMHVLDRVIAVGTINATNSTNVAGVVGNLKPSATVNFGKIAHATSMMYVWANGATAVGGIKAVGGEIEHDTCFYMENSVYNNGASASGTDGATYATYTALYTGSNSSYVNGAFELNAKGTYDALDDFDIVNEATEGGEMPAPRQSLRLADIVDVYMLMYTLNATTASGGEASGKNVYQKSTSSWLVGTAKGTATSPVKIANQQGVSLLKELRFATFEITADVYMPDTYAPTEFTGAFFGTVGGTHYIYIKGWSGQLFNFVAASAALDAHVRAY